MGRRAVAAIAIAAACVGGCGRAAGAELAPPPGPRSLYFSGVDLWRHGGFIHGGLVWSPAGLDQDGFTLKAMISAGSYRYISGALNDAEVIGREFSGQVMPGWRFKFGRTELKLFAGLDVQTHALVPDDPSSGLRGHDAGLRAAFEFWTEPSPNSMIAADGHISSIATSYAIRAAAGWRLDKWFYLGPEAQTFAGDGYRHNRVGAHLTGLKIGTLEWSAATGLARDSDRRRGVYFRLGMLARR